MIILMGVAGAGKSYQGKLLAEECGYSWISSGEVLRAKITDDRREQMLSGKLLSDRETIEVIGPKLISVNRKNEFILDGFPRTQVQAAWMLEQIRSGKLHKGVVLNLVVSEEVVRSRLIMRGRKDDTEDTIPVRFKIYREQTLPILTYFRKEGLEVIDIDASKSPEVVHEEILRKINRAGVK